VSPAKILGRILMQAGLVEGGGMRRKEGGGEGGGN